MIKTKHLGMLSVDAGDVVCFSYDSVMRMAERLGMSDEHFIARFSGVCCNFGADGGYNVTQTSIVHDNGQTYDAVIIGADMDGFARFMTTDDPDFNDFYNNHPYYPQVGTGPNINMDVFNKIVRDYSALMLKKFPTVTCGCGSIVLASSIKEGLCRKCWDKQQEETDEGV